VEFGTDVGMGRLREDTTRGDDEYLFGRSITGGEEKKLVTHCEGDDIWKGGVKEVGGGLNPPFISSPCRGPADRQGRKCCMD
jgi:hypothetical protein